MERLAYSINETARALSLGRTSVYAMIADGRLEAFKRTIFLSTRRNLHPLTGGVRCLCYALGKIRSAVAGSATGAALFALAANRVAVDKEGAFQASSPKLFNGSAQAGPFFLVCQRRRPAGDQSGTFAWGEKAGYGQFMCQSRQEPCR